MYYLIKTLLLKKVNKSYIVLCIQYNFNTSVVKTRNLTYIVPSSMIILYIYRILRNPKETRTPSLISVLYFIVVVVVIVIQK